MAQGENIFSLAQAVFNGDIVKARNEIMLIAEQEKEGSSLKKRLLNLTKRYPSVISLNDLMDSNVRDLVYATKPQKNIEQIIISQENRLILERIFFEIKNKEKFNEYNLKTTNKIMLSGPPGNGKTSIAEAIAHKLDLPFISVNLSNIVSSHLGNTSSNLAKVFKSVQSFPCVLFFDEMETLLTERNNTKQDVGEIARIVSSLLMEIDRLSHNVILVGATNHEDMLDKAVKRRFEVHLIINNPEKELKKEWIKMFKQQHPKIPVEQLLINEEDLFSFSALENRYLNASKEWLMAKILSDSDG